jgi:hypothetical protein
VNLKTGKDSLQTWERKLRKGEVAVSFRRKLMALK